MSEIAGEYRVSGFSEGNRGFADVPYVGRAKEILRELGGGSLGTVFLARDPERDRRVAIKTLDIVGRLGAEAGAAAREALREVFVPGDLLKRRAELQQVARLARVDVNARHVIHTPRRAHDVGDIRHDIFSNWHYSTSMETVTSCQRSSAGTPPEPRRAART